jgi:hypothetical protein
MRKNQIKSNKNPKKVSFLRKLEINFKIMMLN